MLDLVVELRERAAALSEDDVVARRLCVRSEDRIGQADEDREYAVR